MTPTPRATWLMEFTPEKRVKIIVWGELDGEMIEAMESYLARQKARNAALQQAPGA